MVYLHIFVRGGGSSKFELGGELELGFEWKFCKLSVPKFTVTYAMKMCHFLVDGFGIYFFLFLILGT